MSKIVNQMQNDFTIIPNTILQDTRISGLAFKIYCYIAFRLGRSKEWEFYNNEILSHFKEGKKAFSNAKKQLLEYGYLVILGQNHNNDGSFAGNDYEIYAEPQTLPCSQKGHTLKGNALEGNTLKGYTNNKDLNKNDKSNKDIKDTASGSPLSQFEEFWNEYGKKVKKPKAEESYKHALKTKDTTFQGIMKGVKKYNEYLNVAIWLERADPTTWLNQGRWNDDYDDLIKQECKKQGKPLPVQQKSPEKQQEEVKMKEDAQRKREGVLRLLNDNETEFMNYIKESLKTSFTNPLHHFWINDLVFYCRDKVAYLGFTQQKHIDAVERIFTKIEQIIVRELSICDELKAEKIELKLID